jgi:hypothetical protein
MGAPALIAKQRNFMRFQQGFQPKLGCPFYSRFCQHISGYPGEKYLVVG